jgi:Uma2 family endonuclease
MLAERQRITLNEFERLSAQPENRERLLELIDGEIVEKMPTLKHGKIALRFGSYLMRFVDERNLGRVGVEVRHNPTGDDLNSRLPDISYVSAARLPEATDEPLTFMPDLAVEIKSPTDSYTHLRSKALYYLAQGTQMVVLVFSEKSLVEVYQANGDLFILNEADTFTGGDVLPGFSVLVRDILKA